MNFEKDFYENKKLSSKFEMELKQLENIYLTPKTNERNGKLKISSKSRDFENIYEQDEIIESSEQSLSISGGEFSDLDPLKKVVSIKKF